MRALERWLIAICDALACGVLALMAVIVSIEVLSRSLFGVSTNVAEELASLGLIVVLFLGLPGAFAQNAMIRVDVLYQSFGRRLRAWVDQVFRLIAIAVTAVYLWYLLDMMRSSFRLGFRTDTALGIPVYLPQLTMVLGVAALIVVALIALLPAARTAEADLRGEVEAGRGA
jgi:TRAP-type C4-dicarboxylate transport system permease small subunit